MSLLTVLDLVVIVGICAGTYLQVRQRPVPGSALMAASSALGAGVDIAGGDTLFAIVMGALVGFWAYRTAQAAKQRHSA